MTEQEIQEIEIMRSRRDVMGKPDLAAIETRHRSGRVQAGGPLCVACSSYANAVYWPCDAVRLSAYARELEAQVATLEAERDALREWDAKWQHIQYRDNDRLNECGAIIDQLRAQVATLRAALEHEVRCCERCHGEGMVYPVRRELYGGQPCSRCACARAALGDG